MCIRIIGRTYSIDGCTSRFLTEQVWGKLVLCLSNKVMLMLLFWEPLSILKRMLAQGHTFFTGSKPDPLNVKSQASLPQKEKSKRPSQFQLSWWDWLSHPLHFVLNFNNSLYPVLCLFSPCRYWSCECCKTLTDLFNTRLYHLKGFTTPLECYPIVSIFALFPN
jgi:hypothetical protein